MKGTHKMLELLEHPGKSLGSYADSFFIKTGLLVNDGRFAVSYLDDVDVGKGPSLGRTVSQEFDREVEVLRTTSTRARNSSPDISQKGERSSKSAS